MVSLSFGQTLFAVSQEHIIKSNDGGVNWSTVYTGTADVQKFHAIYFISPTTGFVFGNADASKVGAVLKTTDGGNTWVDQAANLPAIAANINFYCVTKESTTVLYVGGSSGVILKYVVATNTWTNPISYGLNNWVSSLYAIDNNTVIGVLQKFQAINKVIKTTNGGTTWNYSTITLTEDQILESVVFNGGVGFITTCQADMPSKRLFKSTDNGSSWLGESSTIFYGGADDANLNLSMPNINNMFVGGSTYDVIDGRFWSTSNGGTTWNDLSSNLDVAVNSLWSSLFINENIGWVGTGDGEILYTTNGGVNWLLYNTPLKDGIEDICKL